ncbi:MAG: acylneuraminate cytidylyltransferase family protein [Gemmatimonadetes bacterium]|nr:acylneuraminate cytidylyltransferase family protein [Gemmatimonadota bacterium]
MNPRIMALVPARGGSKRIPGKNIRELGGRPLIEWSIGVARDIPEICDIVVSTDDFVIANVAKAAGALVPWLRPELLSTDTASSIDVCLHALDWYEAERGEVGGLLLLQPTSPFRSRESVERGIELFRTHNGRTVVGVSPAKSHPMWCVRVTELTMHPFMDMSNVPARSQDLPPAYVINGTFYLASPDALRGQRSFEGADTIPLVIDSPAESIDIDTEWDWAVAETVVRLRG